MEVIFDFVKGNRDFIILYSIVFNILALILVKVQGNRLSRLGKRYKNLARNMEGKNLEEIIYNYYDKIDEMSLKINEMEEEVQRINGKLLRCIQKVGIVRYNAFENMGGDLSFSIAILDEEHNGIILTSIFNRDGNVMYGKPVKNGNVFYTLSAEELQALDRAKSNSLDEYNKMIS